MYPLNFDTHIFHPLNQFFTDFAGIRPQAQDSLFKPTSITLDPERLDSILNKKIPLLNGRNEELGLMHVGTFLTKLNHLLKAKGLCASRIDIAGGTVKYVIGSEEAAKFAEKNGIKKDHIVAFDRLRDIDLAFDMSNHPNEVLHKIPDIVSSAIIESTLFHDSEYGYDQVKQGWTFHNRFTRVETYDSLVILSIGSPDGLLIDLSFTNINSRRRHLCSIDAAKIDIRPYLEGHPYLAWATDLEDPEKPIRHILEKKFWVDDIDTVNYMGLLRVALNIANGYQMVDENDKLIDYDACMKELVQRLVDFHFKTGKSIVDTFQKVCSEHIGEVQDRKERFFFCCLPYLASYLSADELRCLLSDLILSDQWDPNRPASKFIQCMDLQLQRGIRPNNHTIKCLIWMLDLKPACEPTLKDWKNFIAESRQYHNRFWVDLFRTNRTHTLITYYKDKKIPNEIPFSELIRLMEIGVKKKDEAKSLQWHLFNWQIDHDIHTAAIKFIENQQTYSEYKLNQKLFEQALKASESLFPALFDQLYDLVPPEQKEMWIAKLASGTLWHTSKSCMLKMKDSEFLAKFFLHLKPESQGIDFINIATQQSADFSKWERYGECINIATREILLHKDFKQLDCFLTDMVIAVLQIEHLDAIIRYYLSTLPHENNLLMKTIKARLNRGQIDKSFLPIHTEILKAISISPAMMTEIIELYLAPSLQQPLESLGEYEAIMEFVYNALAGRPKLIKEKWIERACESKANISTKCRWIKNGIGLLFDKAEQEIGQNLRARLVKMAETCNGSLNELIDLYGILANLNLIVNVPSNCEAYFASTSNLEQMNRLWTAMNKSCVFPPPKRQAIIEKLIYANAAKNPQLAEKLFSENISYWSDSQSLNRLILQLPKETSVRNIAFKRAPQWDYALWMEIQQKIRKDHPRFFEIYDLKQSVEGDREIIRHVLDRNINANMISEMVKRWKPMSKDDLAKALNYLKDQKNCVEVADHVLAATAKICSSFEKGDVNELLSNYLILMLQKFTSADPEKLLTSFRYVKPLVSQVDYEKQLLFVSTWIDSCTKQTVFFEEDILNEVVPYVFEIFVKNHEAIPKGELQNWQKFFASLSKTKHPLIEHFVGWLSYFENNCEKAKKLFSDALGEADRKKALTDLLIRNLHSDELKLKAHKQAGRLLVDQSHQLAHLEEKLLQALKKTKISNDIFVACKPQQAKAAIDSEHLNTEGKEYKKEVDKRLELYIKIFTITLNISKIRKILPTFDNEITFKLFQETLFEAYGAYLKNPLRLFEFEPFIDNSYALSEKLLLLLKLKSDFFNKNLVAKTTCEMLEEFEFRMLNQLEWTNEQDDMAAIRERISQLDTVVGIFSTVNRLIAPYLDRIENDASLKQRVQNGFKECLKPVKDYKRLCELTMLEILDIPAELTEEAKNALVKSNGALFPNLKQLENLIGSMMKLSSSFSFLASHAQDLSTYLKEIQNIRIRLTGALLKNNLKIEFTKYEMKYLKIDIDERCNRYEKIVSFITQIESDPIDLQWKNKFVRCCSNFLEGKLGLDDVEKMFDKKMTRRKIATLNDQINQLYTCAHRLVSDKLLTSAFIDSTICPLLRLNKLKLLEIKDASTSNDKSSKLLEIEIFAAQTTEFFKILFEFETYISNNAKVEAAITARIKGQSNNEEFKLVLIEIKKKVEAARSPVPACAVEWRLSMQQYMGIPEAPMTLKDLNKAFRFWSLSNHPDKKTDADEEDVKQATYIYQQVNEMFMDIQNLAEQLGDREF